MNTKQAFFRILLVLGLVGVFLMGPNPVKASKEHGWWDAPGNDPAIHTEYYNEGGWSGEKTTNSRTGEYHVEASTIDPQTGERKEQTRTSNPNNPNAPYDSTLTTIHKDGSKDSTHTVGDGSGKMTATDTHTDAQGNSLPTQKNVTYPDGHREKTMYSPQTGKMTSWTRYDKDGSTTSYGYDSNGKLTSKTSYDPKTNKTVTKKCDTPLACRDDVNRLATEKGKTLPKPPGLTGSGSGPGGKDKVKADVLKQIQDKPGGDLSVGKEKLKTGVLDKAKAGSLEVGTKADVLKGAKEKVLTEKLEKSKVGPLQTKPKALDVTGTQKEKLSVTPRGKSIGQSVQGIEPAKKQIQTQSAQPFKGKAKGQDFGSPAGSPGLLQRGRK